MDKFAELQSIHQFGVDAAVAYLYDKVATVANSGWTKDDVDAMIEKRAQDALAAVSFSGKIEAVNSIIAELDKVGMKDAAAYVSKIAQEELADVELPQEAEEAGEAGAEGEASPEEAQAAAIDGAAGVLADLTGKDPDDEEVQAAAAQIVQEAIVAQDEEAAGGAGASVVE